MEKTLFSLAKGIIPACDVPEIEDLMNLTLATFKVPGVNAYKVGLELTIPFGLTEAVSKIRGLTDNIPVIYDHQKAGNDIPELGIKFAKAVKKSGADAIIIFPFGGAKTEREWIKACQEEGLVVLVGGHMTQAEFLESEGGFIGDLSPERIFRIACECGVKHFVLPGNKVPFVEKYRGIIKEYLKDGEYTISAPGFIKQGGVFSETGKVAGPCWNGIVGGGIYEKMTVEEMRKAAIEYTSQIVGQ